MRYFKMAALTRLKESGDAESISESSVSSSGAITVSGKQNACGVAEGPVISYHWRPVKVPTMAILRGRPAVKSFTIPISLTMPEKIDTLDSD